MNIYKLISRNLYYYRKKHISVVLGVILSTTILTGALVIGDSVKYSLQRIVYKRLGNIQYALTSADRVFRQQLANDLSGKTEARCSAILHTKGIVISAGGQKRLNNIQFYGIDEHFEKFSQTNGIYDQLSTDEIIINSYIAEKMKLSAGDEVLLRLEKLAKMPKDSPLSDDSDITVADRLKIKFIATDETFGRFGLKSEQIAPFNVFLKIEKLASLMEMENSANILLLSPDPENEIGLKELNSILAEEWTIDDSGIKLNTYNNLSGVELRSSRIFLDNPIIEASDKSGIKFAEVFTYFVNEIKNDKNLTPYSFVSAIDPQLLNPAPQDNEIVINTWAARDLMAKVGSKLTLSYFIVGDNRNLMVDSADFTISQIVTLEGIYGDKNLLPDYPGLSEMESCLDWHPGIPIDFDKIRKKDEAYWEKYRGIPKAFISLNRAKELWHNRFGNLTAIRFSTDNKSLLEKRLSDTINPLDWNIQFLDVKKAGLEASEHSVDFSGLFIGLSFFVIVSALLLTSMLFLFNMESRSHETGLFLGIGLERTLIKKIIFSEAGILIFTGTLLGSAVAIFYNKLILMALITVWSDAVGTSALEIHIKPMTIVTGFILVAGLNFLTIWFNLRKTSVKNVHHLQRGLKKLEVVKTPAGKRDFLICVISFIAALILLIAIDPGKGSEVFAQYFSIGFLLLIAGISLAGYLLKTTTTSSRDTAIKRINLIQKEISRKRGRSILLISLLASSLFIVFTVGINKKDVTKSYENNKSGSGGYSLFGETSVPVYGNLNTIEYRKKFGLSGFSDAELRFVQMKIKSGDDASCLNLNRVKNPHVIGINSLEFINKDAFSFAVLSKHVDKANPWSVIDRYVSDNTIYGIADASVIQWQLGKSVGDTLKYNDDSGEEFYIILAAGLENSIFQGNILISESNFLERFPSVSGSRVFIAETPLENIDKTILHINSAMQDYGLNLSTTSERLAEFNKIENTYLSIFLILGSFGILIGSLGIGVVVFRSVYEQRQEFALLQAVGFNKKEIIALINKSYQLILLYGVCVGVTAALTASLPYLNSVSSEMPYSLISLIILLIFLAGLSSIFFTAKYSLKGNIIRLLRNE